MSWPSTDFECRIQDELDELRAFKARFDALRAQPAASKFAVLNELSTMVSEWGASVDSPETCDDVETLRLICEALKEL